MPDKRYQKRKEAYDNSFSTVFGRSRVVESESLQKLGSAYSRLSKNVDNTEGILSAGDLTELINNYTALLKTLDEYFKEEDGIDFLPDEKASLLKDRKTLSKDLKALENYEKKLKAGKITDENALSFSEILEKARAKKVEVNAEDIKYAGAGQNVRMVINAGDKNIYFTPSVEGNLNVVKADRLREDMMKKYGKKADFLKDKGIIDAANLLYHSAKKDNFTINNASQTIGGSTMHMVTILRDEMKNTGAAEAVGNLLEDPLKARIFIDYMNQVEKINGAASIISSQGINISSKHDKRNSAMSMLADEFGMGDLLAHSENVNLIINDNGKKKKIHGTAMDEAVGIDPGKADKNSNYLKLNETSFENANVIKQISDLQVLDFIAGNPDRHPNNICYTINENGDVQRVQAIDNDTSFGALFVANNENLRAVAPEFMSVITKSTADKILAMDKQRLSFMLQGYDLTSAEIDAAGKRLDEMKKVINESKAYYANKKYPEGVIDTGHPRIVDDDKLKEYSFHKDCAWSHMERNPVTKKVDMSGNYFAALSNIDPLKALDKIRGNNMNEANKIMKDMLLDDTFKTMKTCTRMGQVDRKLQTGSGNFTDMRNKTKLLREKLKSFNGALFESVGNQPDFNASEKDYKLTDEALELKESIREALNATNTYIEGKEGDTKKNKVGSRAWKRYQFAIENREELKKKLAGFEKAEKLLADNRELNGKRAELEEAAEEKRQALDQKHEDMKKKRENKKAPAL